ncbi:MAG TPA: MFS transporter [Rhizomicrobium sp.]|nr:MFS transporter [Rhizomicrobium sp.]
MRKRDQYDSLSAIVSMIGTGECGSCIGIIMPGIVIALTQSHGLPTYQAAFVASAESFGITAATVLVSYFMGAIDRRLLGLTAITLAAVADFATALISSYHALVALRFIAGAGEGLAIAVMVGSFAGVKVPDRIFAIEIVINTAVAMAFFAVVRQLTNAGNGSAVFYVMSVVTVLAAGFLVRLPAHAPVTATLGGALPEMERMDARTLTASILGLAAMLCLYIAIGIVWPLVGQLGIAMGLPRDNVSLALTNSTFFGMASGVVVAGIGGYFGRSVPLLLGLLTLVAVVAGMALGSMTALFGLATGMFMFCWLFSIAYFMGLLAAIDSKGRVVTFALPMQFLGLALGPLVAAFVLKAFVSQTYCLWLAISLLLLATALVLCAERMFRKASKELSSFGQFMPPASDSRHLVSPKKLGSVL